jgi:hypothetical protein
MKRTIRSSLDVTIVVDPRSCGLIRPSGDGETLQ